jgi:hypothetical protein
MKYNPIFKRFIAYFFILGILTGCNQYNRFPYSNSASPNADNLVLEDNGDIKSENILIHSNGVTYGISDAVVEKNQVTGKLIALDLDAESYTSSISNEYEGDEKSKDELYAHFYDTSNSLTEGQEIMISVDDHSGAVSLKYKKGNFWKYVGYFFLVLAGLLVGLIVLLLIACNCPHAYTFDGEKYHFTNTLFTGATAANLERDDYKILNDYRFDSDSYEMIIKNEENESHFINLLELIVVNHDENIEVIPDQNGQVHSISNLVEATQIVNDKGDDLSKMLVNRDDLAYSFDSDLEENMVNTYATFDKPDDVTNAKVVLKLKNSEWGGLVYKTFGSMLGDRYESWVEKNHERSSEEANAAMKKAGIPLVVSIKKENAWIEVETIDLIGEVSYNTLVANIDENLITGDKIELRLQAGFKLWDLDYVGMDFSQEENLEVEVIKPALLDGNEVDISALENDDDSYFDQLHQGDSTYFKFEGLKSSSAKRTIIMHSKGYYISHEEYTGDTYWMKLLKLRGTGGLSKLSKEVYESFQDIVLAPSVNQ